MKFSLKKKSILFVLVIAVVLSCVAVFVGYRVYSDTMDEHYETTSFDLAKTAAAMVDAEQVREYAQSILEIYRQAPMPEFETAREEADYYAQYAPLQDESYREMFDILQGVKTNNRDVQYLYLFTLDPESRSGVYILDADTSESACPMGTWDIIYPENYAVFEDPERGFPAYITRTEEFGWLCSAGAPVVADDGAVVAYAMIEVSMNDVMADRADFLRNISLAMAAVTIVLAAVFILLVNRSVVLPINRLAAAASSFVEEKNAEEKGPSGISQLNIHTGDEIQALYEAVKKMEIDIDQFIAHISAITAEKERIGAELNVATQIQADMLPRIFPPFPERPEFDIYASMTPAKEVGGDFYDFFLVDDDHLALVIADVSGKGVPAALFMVIAKTLLKNAAQTGLSPRAVLEKVNNQLCENNEAEMFVTVWLGVYEISTGRLTAANAGHEYPAIQRADGAFELYRDRHGFVLAGMENARYREYELELGVAEATDGANTLYGTDRMLSALNRGRGRMPEELLRDMKADIDRFVGGAPQFDDITMLAIRRRDTGKETMKKRSVEPSLDQIGAVSAFFEGELAAHQAPPKVIAQVNVAIDEIFSNIARYSGATSATVGCEVEAGRAVLRFTDNGRPYDPTQQADPDTTLGAEEREIGGLGIFMVKKTMDRITYAYADGMNVLTIEKSW